MPFVISFHEAPKSLVRYTNGSRLFTWWKSTATYAVPASCRDGSTLPTVPHGGRLGMYFVTLVQLLPPSRDTWTSPSFVLTQITPACLGDSALEWMTIPYSTPHSPG